MELQQFREYVILDDPRVGTITPTKDDQGITHIKVVDVDLEWELVDGQWEIKYPL